MVDDDCVTTSVIVCFETEGMIGEAVTVFVSFKVWVTVSMVGVATPGDVFAAIPSTSTTEYEARF